MEVPPITAAPVLIATPNPEISSLPGPDPRGRSPPLHEFSQSIYTAHAEIADCVDDVLQALLLLVLMKVARSDLSLFGLRDRLNFGALGVRGGWAGISAADYGKPTGKKKKWLDVHCAMLHQRFRKRPDASGGKYENHLPRHGPAAPKCIADRGIGFINAWSSHSKCLVVFRRPRRIGTLLLFKGLQTSGGDRFCRLCR